MAPEDKVGLTKRQIRITERAEAVVEKAGRRVKALEEALAGARKALLDAQSDMRRIDEMGDCL